MQKVLMVCTGNICRSPTADGVLRHLVAQHRLKGRIEVDSAGTQSYHAGEAPDRRSQKHAKQRGYDLSQL
ncbi:MAG: low molecular weight phosphotyrosine protein phosphatase, partial [Deefgea sp.]